MRKSEATIYGTRRRKRVCGKFSLWLGTEASFNARSDEDTRSQSRCGSRTGEIRDKSSVGCEEREIQVRCHPSGGETRKNSSRREFDGFCCLKSANIAEHLQTYKGRVVLWEDNVKDEEGYRAVFAERGASAPQMAAAKFLDTFSKRRGMVGVTSDAI